MTKSNEIFFFNNPISLILLKASELSNDGTFVQASYVNPSPLKRNFNYRYSTLSADANFSLAQGICKILNISLSRIEWRDFEAIKSPYAESLLIKKTASYPGKIQMYAADSYCIFGFSYTLRFILTKLRLIIHWRTHLKVRKKTRLYIVNKSKATTNFRNVEIIDCDQSNLLLESVCRILSPELFNNCGLKLKDKYLLVLPYPNFPDSIFLTKFFSRAQDLAEKESLKILLKPHRKDKNDYSRYFYKEIISPRNPELFKQIPVEILFKHSGVQKIIAAPSTSLYFADDSKLEIIAPKNSHWYKSYFLDCEPYLKFIAKKYILL